MTRLVNRNLCMGISVLSVSSVVEFLSDDRRRDCDRVFERVIPPIQ